MESCLGSSGVEGDHLLGTSLVRGHASSLGDDSKAKFEVRSQTFRLCTTPCDKDPTAGSFPQTDSSPSAFGSPWDSLIESV